MASGPVPQVIQIGQLGPDHQVSIDLPSAKRVFGDRPHDAIHLVTVIGSARLGKSTLVELLLHGADAELTSPSGDRARDVVHSRTYVFWCILAMTKVPPEQAHLGCPVPTGRFNDVERICCRRFTVSHDGILPCAHGIEVAFPLPTLAQLGYHGGDRTRIGFLDLEGKLWCTGLPSNGGCRTLAIWPMLV